VQKQIAAELESSLKESLIQKNEIEGEKRESAETAADIS
jgi:hypothetical protein